MLWCCWLGGRKGIRPVKNWVLVWLSVWIEMQTCIWPSWCHCHSLSLASVKSRLVLPFWYWLTPVVPEKGLLNGCVCVCVCSKKDCCICMHVWWFVHVWLEWWLTFEKLSCMCVCLQLGEIGQNYQRLIKMSACSQNGSNQHILLDLMILSDAYWYLPSYCWSHLLP